MQMEYDFEDMRQTRSLVSDSAGRIAGFAEPLHGRGEYAQSPLAGRHPDWAGLRLRFLAAHSLRRTLLANAGASVPAGSFALAGEAVLAACRGDASPVNPVYSGNGKGPCLTNGLVAAHPTPGDRGPQ